MDLFFNIDWQKLKNSIDDLEDIAYKTSTKNGKSKLQLTRLLYQIEMDLTEIKKKLDLPILNPNIRSESVEKSFDRIDHYSEIFEREKIEFKEYFRSNDYQYWLLIFLLIENKNIRKNKLTLYEIIDLFIERVKEKSFSLEDIELTASGATRCITNLRFAFTDLKELGLISLYNRENKNSWTLTYFGFFVAASFCILPEDKNKKPLNTEITKFNQSAYYYNINWHILDRTYQLSNPEYFYALVDHLGLDMVCYKNLEKGSEIFKIYFESVSEIFNKIKKENTRHEKLAELIKKINTDYQLAKFTEVLSEEFDAHVLMDKQISLFQ